jgi:hypothetical protein
LGYLQNTSLYAETLASYSVSLDPVNNVALAAPTQGIYQPDWTPADRSTAVQVLPGITPYLDGMNVVDFIDAADIDSEAAHAYQWSESRATGGFPTEYYQFDTIGCLADCSLMDGGRRINGEESFTLATTPNADLILVTRLHPADAGTFDVYANGILVATRVIPALPGAWLEVPTLVPAALVTDATRIRIVPHTSGDYMPYYHWAYQGSVYQPEMLDNEPLATFQSGALQLQSVDFSEDFTPSGEPRVAISLTWQTDGTAQGDAKIFVHLLDADGNTVAQADVRPGGGALPPGNWLLGGIHDIIGIPVPPGRYHIVMGLYDPITLDRLEPSGAAADQDRRVRIGDIEVR